MPLYFLRVWGTVTALRLYPVAQLAVSGNKDGALNFWNLLEPSHYHSNYNGSTIRTPSVTTSQ